MKILHVYKTYYPYSYGGIEKFIETLSTNTATYGVINELVTCAPVSKITEEENTSLKKTFYPITFEKSSCPVSLSFLRHFKEKANQSDVIHFHFPWPFADFSTIISGIKKPYIVTYHSDIIRQKFLKFFYSPWMMRFLNHANRIVATSSPYAVSSDTLRHFKHNVSVIPIGLNDIYTPSEITLSDKPYFLFMGALREYKGLMYLIEAMRTITQFDLIIAGDGPCRTELIDKIHHAQLTNVKMAGKIDENKKWELYRQAYGVISSAHLRNEAYCYMLVEGLMFGKPLISTELGTGTSYVNAHQETGIVVPPRDSSMLRNAMVQLIENPSLAKTYGIHARQRFLNLFTADTMTTSYLKLYEEISRKI